MGKVEDAMKTVRNNISQKTGRPYEDWLAMAKSQGLVKHSELMTWPKTTHGFSHGYANAIALDARAQAAPVVAGTVLNIADDMVVAQYAGAKAGLRPIYDALIVVLQTLGNDVEIAPKKAYVSIRRNKQFALIQPSTSTRLDLGIKLASAPADTRLESSGSFNAMVSHRVRLGGVSDVDQPVKQWLKLAYEQA
jgi:predicted transport protein